MTEAGDTSAALCRAGYYKESGRLDDCGMKRLLLCGACGTPREGTYHCDLALCPGCARRRAARLRDAWRAAIPGVPVPPGYRWVLLTLTLKPSGAHVEALRADVARILWAWRLFLDRLRRRYDPTKQHMGGFFSVEVAGAVHLHVLAVLPYVEQRVLGDIWRDVTGDSYIVDIRAVRGAEAACAEVCKYISKAVGGNCDGDAERAVAVWAAVRGRQIHRPFGVLFGRVQRPAVERVPCPACGAHEWFPAELLQSMARTARPVLASGYG